MDILVVGQEILAQTMVGVVEHDLHVAVEAVVGTNRP